MSAFEYSTERFELLPGSDWEDAVNVARLHQASNQGVVYSHGLTGLGFQAAGAIDVVGRTEPSAVNFLEFAVGAIPPLNSLEIAQFTEGVELGVRALNSTIVPAASASLTGDQNV